MCFFSFCFSGEDSRDLAANCHLLWEKDLINVDRLCRRVIQSWRQRRSQYWKHIECQSNIDSDCPRRARMLLPLPLCQLQELSVGVKAKGTLICRQATRISRLRESITCMALLQNGLGRILRSVSVRHSKEILATSRECMSD